MTRSVWKGPFVDGYLLKKADAVQNTGRNDVIKTGSRRVISYLLSPLMRYGHESLRER